MEIWWKSDGNLMEIWWKFDGNLMEIWWKSDGNLMEIWWKSDGNLMEIWWKSDGNLMEIWWKSDGNLMEIWWKSDGNLMEIGWKFDGNLMEIWWKFDGNLTETGILWKSSQVLSLRVGTWANPADGTGPCCICLPKMHSGEELPSRPYVSPMILLWHLFSMILQCVSHGFPCQKMMHQSARKHSKCCCMLQVLLKLNFDTWIHVDSWPSMVFFCEFCGTLAHFGSLWTFSSGPLWAKGRSPVSSPLLRGPFGAVRSSKPWGPQRGPSVLHSGSSKSGSFSSTSPAKNVWKCLVKAVHPGQSGWQQEIYRLSSHALGPFWRDNRSILGKMLDHVFGSKFFQLLYLLCILTAFWLHSDCILICSYSVSPFQSSQIFIQSGQIALFLQLLTGRRKAVRSSSSAVPAGPPLHPPAACGNASMVRPRIGVWILCGLYKMEGGYIAGTHLLKK